MARIRTVKPEFFRHEGLSLLSIEAHFLAVSLLCYADDDGYFNANPKLISAECFPLRDEYGSPTVVIPELLRELSKQGYLRTGSSGDGRRYGQIINFTKHQVINKKRPSDIKDLAIEWDDYRRTTVVLQEDSRPEGNGNRKEEEGNGKENNVANAPDDLPNDPDLLNKEKPNDHEFLLPDWVNQEVWDLWMDTRPGKKLTPKQKQAQISKLEKWRDDGIDYASALVDSAANGWKGLFEPGKMASSQRQALQSRDAARMNSNKDAMSNFAVSQQQPEPKSLLGELVW